jgi:enamine deaminase RidA (YjgF/YER057c/UK114 family)
VLGFVNCTPDFTKQPVVMNGFSNLMVEVFGHEVGTHARSAIGAGSLPGGIPVEVEMLVELV